LGRLFKYALLIWMALYFSLSWGWAAESFEIISPSNQHIDSKSAQKISLSSTNLISLDYMNANLSDVLKAISYSYDLNIVVTKDMSGTVSAKLNDLTLEDALNAILSINNYAFMRKGNIVYVMPKSEVELVIESVPLNFLTPSEAKDFLGRATSRGDIQANTATNSLIVKASPSEIENIKQIIKTVDVPPIQVLIEAKIVDISNSYIQKIGTTINLKYDPASGHLSQLEMFTGNPPATTTTTTTGTTTSTSTRASAVSSDNGDGAIYNIGGRFNEFNPSLTIDALVNENKARVLASPSITTINGKEASITIGQKVAYISGSTSNAGGTTSSTQFADIGTKLRVTPMVSLDGWITLKVHPEVSTLLGITTAGPNIATREADAIVRVKDNQMIVIGGLINRSDLRDRNGVPFFKDIPALGWLFKRHGDQLDNGNLTVFITPHIIPMPVKATRQVNEAIHEVNTNQEVDMLSGLLRYADSLELDKTKDDAKNLYLNEERIKAYRMILEQFPQSSKSDYCLYKIAFIYAKEFGRCDAAKETLMELKSINTQSGYIDITESLVNACMAVSNH
jgi:type IV pilus assembly protein PilQ